MKQTTKTINNSTKLNADGSISMFNELCQELVGDIQKIRDKINTKFTDRDNKDYKESKSIIDQ